MSDPWDWQSVRSSATGGTNEVARAPVTLSKRRPPYQIIVPWRTSGVEPPPLPEGPWGTDPPPAPMVPRPEPRLVPDSAERMQTGHGANGIIPLIVGGPLPTGGLIVGGPYETAGHVYIDFLICEGPIEAITDLKCSGQTFAELGMVQGTDYNIHLGTAGDTTDAIIASQEAGYTVADYTARVSCRFPRPNQTTGNYNPLDFECTVTGLLCTDPATLTIPATASKNPFHHLYEAKINTRWGEGKAATEVDAASFAAAAVNCDVDIDPGAGTIKRWEISQKFDRDMPAQQFTDVVRLQCHGNVVFGDKWKGFVDVSRAASGITLRDADPISDNINCERFRFETAGPDEVPTVVVVDWTDASDGFKDASVQYPDPSPAGVYIEHRFSCRGITTVERARRHARQTYKRLQLDKRISTETLQIGLQLEPGDRVACASRRLVSTGTEEAFITEMRALGDRWGAHLELYREDVYSDTASTTGPPVTPNAPDEFAIPPAVTGLEAPYGTADERGRIRFFPSAFAWIREYVIYDLYGSPAEPRVLLTIPRETPLNAAGKYETFLQNGIHTSPTGSTFNIAVTAVSIHSRESARASASWAVGTSATVRTKALYGRATYLQKLSSTSWNDARTAASATAVTQDEVWVLDRKSAVDWIIVRTLMEWEARGEFPDDAVIMGVALELHVKSSPDARSCEAHVTNVVTTLLGEHPFDTADYNNLGATSYGSREFANSPHSGYLRIPETPDVWLAAGANANVNLTTGKTFFGLRTDGDLDNVEPTVGDITNHLTAEGDADISPGPKLIVQYTSASEDAEAQVSRSNAIFEEIPSGDVDSVNATFVALKSPVVGNIIVTRGYIQMREGVHYDRPASGTVVFRAGETPLDNPDETIRFSYQYEWPTA